MSSVISKPHVHEQIYLLPDPEEEARRSAPPVIQGYTEREMQSARAESHRAGKEEAWREIAPLKQEMEEETRRAVAAWLGVAKQLEQEWRTVLTESAEEVVRFAVDVAEVITRKEIEQSPESIVPLVRQMLERAAAAERILIRLSPRDHGYLKTHPGLIGEVDSFANLRLRPDSSIESGGCVVESEQGNWDARLGTQLELLRAELTRPSAQTDAAPLESDTREAA